MDEKREHSGTRVILVVDDEPSIRDLLRLILEMEGYVIETAANGKEALNALPSRNRPCLILLDLMMPVMNGWEFYSAIRADQRFKDIPVVVLTAYSKREIEMPPVEILNKPVDIPSLRELTLKYCHESGGSSG